MLDLSVLSNVTICAVTKNHSVAEIEDLLKRLPQIKDIAENRWPDCEEKFKHFAITRPDLRRHFIGPLQSNKITKVVALCDVIQSVESFEKLVKIDECAKKLNKSIEVLLQVNISGDPLKHGIAPEEVPEFIEKYLCARTTDFSTLPQLSHVRITGLMTIGEQAEIGERFLYFSKLKSLFDKVNTKCPLEVLSMGMSEDYPEAIRAGATMVRLGTILF